MSSLTTSTAVRIAAAGSAGLGLAATAHADFTGVLLNADGAKPRNTYSSVTTGTAFANWTFTRPELSNFLSPTVDTTSAASLIITTLGADFSNFNAPVFGQFILNAPLGAGVLSFDYDLNSSNGNTSGGEAAFTVNGGASWTQLGYAPTDNFIVNLAAGDVFGFRVGDSYFNNDAHSLTVSDISFTAIPEPGSTGTLAAVAALGYAGLVASRRRRRA